MYNKHYSCICLYFYSDLYRVELGKELAKAIEPELAATSKGNHDGSTQGIIDFILKHGK